MNPKTRTYDSGADIGMAVDYIIDEIEKAQEVLEKTPRKGKILSSESEKKYIILSSESEKKYILARIDVLKQKADEILYPLLK